MVRSSLFLLALSACAPSTEPAGYTPVFEQDDAGLVATFGATVQIDDRGGEWSVELRHAAWGRAGSMTAMGDVAAGQGDDGRVRYDYAGISAWYEPLTEGFKQGFDVAERPAGTGPLRVETEVAAGDLLPLKLHDGVRFLDGEGRGRLLVDALVVRDANGVVLPSEMTWSCDVVCVLGIDVDDEGAAYPIEIDPRFWTLQQKLFPTANPEDSQAYGFAVDIDGDFAIVGMPGANIGAFNGLGRAVLLRRQAGVWAEADSTVIPNNTGFRQTNAGLGTSVAISGNRVLVGAPGAGATSAGVVMAARIASDIPNDVHTFANRNFFQHSAPVTGDRFGSAVDLQGTRAIIGASGDDAGGVDSGTAYIFLRGPGNANNYTQEAELAPSFLGTGIGVGSAVAITADEATVVVGAPQTLVAGNVRGRVAVFTRSGVTWTEEAVLDSSSANTPDQIRFGAALAVDGNTAVVGAPGFDDGANVDEGRAEVFTRSGIVWSAGTAIGGTGDAGDLFGTSVSLIESMAIAVGAPEADLVTVDNDGTGEAHLFGFQAGSYVPENVVTVENAIYDSGADFGRAVAIDGSDLIVGAPQVDVKRIATDVGAVFLFAGLDDATDADGDGFIAEGGGGDDCNDAVFAINPSASEDPSNGVDENCDDLDADCGTVTVGLCTPEIAVTEVFTSAALSDSGNSRWLEIQNTGTQTIDLRGSWMQAFAGINFRGEYQVEGFVVLDPGEAAVFGAEDNTGVNGGVVLTESWEIPDGQTILTLPVNNGTINLLDRDRSATLDTLTYTPLYSTGFLEPSGASYSIDPDFADPTLNDTPSFWCDGRSAYGIGHFGTPGVPNDDCDYTITIDYDFAAVNDALEAPQTVSFMFDATDRWFETSNAGEGTFFRTTDDGGFHFGQQLVFTYFYTDLSEGPDYIGLQPFGADCVPGGTMEDTANVTVGVWIDPTCP